MARSNNNKPETPTEPGQQFGTAERTDEIAEAYDLTDAPAPADEDAAVADGPLSELAGAAQDLADAVSEVEAAIEARRDPFPEPDKAAKSVGVEAGSMGEPTYIRDGVTDVSGLAADGHVLPVGRRPADYEWTTNKVGELVRVEKA